MDLFKKKKIRRLLDELEDSNNKLIQERTKTKEYKEMINNFEKISTKTMEENQKLIKWIMNILDTFGTMEVKERRNIQIPVYELWNEKE